eukprot:TRINITY_DN44428_c0_g1_i1.p1 TRINITY_DN44428_c0_g1~~TRINITY_DN44428_c0_g1_i1.p1  ORF type:complete len:175 (-),score=32.30 TRINITY_DN44428_c0_g1_i1:193-717(-)
MVMLQFFGFEHPGVSPNTISASSLTSALLLTIGYSGFSSRVAGVILGSAMSMSDEAKMLEERGHRAAIRYNDDTFAEQINVNQQSFLFRTWRGYKSKCYDMWMDNPDSDALMHAHEVLSESVSRCRTNVRERSNHVKLVGVCHEEVVMKFERCLAAAAKSKPKVAVAEAASSVE